LFTLNMICLGCSALFTLVTSVCAWSEELPAYHCIRGVSTRQINKQQNHTSVLRSLNVMVAQ